MITISFTNPLVISFAMSFSVSFAVLFAISCNLFCDPLRSLFGLHEIATAETARTLDHTLVLFHPTFASRPVYCLGIDVLSFQSGKVKRRAPQNKEQQGLDPKVMQTGFSRSPRSP